MLCCFISCSHVFRYRIGVICENLGIPRPKRPEPYYSFFPIYSKFEVNENAGFNMGDDNCLRKIFIKNGKLRFEMRAVLRPGRFLGNHYLAFTVPMRTFIITMDRIRQGARAARENKKVAAREKKLLTQLSEEYIARPANEQRTTSKEANSTEESDNEPLNRRLFSFLWNKRPPMPPKSKSFFSRFVEGYTLVERDGEANNERFMGEISFWFGRQGRSSNDDSSQSEESMNQ